MIRDMIYYDILTVEVEEHFYKVASPLGYQTTKQKKRGSGFRITKLISS